MNDSQIAAAGKQMTNPAHPGFRFTVEIEGLPEAAFTECSLPTVEWEIEEIKEGGLNTHTHQLLGRRKAGRLTLKNGVGTSQLVQWYIDTMGNKFSQRSVTIKMLDSKLQTVMCWHVEKAHPIKWSGPQLKTSDNSIAIQTLELACGLVTVSTSEK